MLNQKSLGLLGPGGSAISSSRSGGLATGRGGGSSSSNAVRSHKPGMNCIFFRWKGGEFEFGCGNSSSTSVRSHKSGKSRIFFRRGRFEFEVGRSCNGTGGRRAVRVRVQFEVTSWERAAFFFAGGGQFEFEFGFEVGRSCNETGGGAVRVRLQFEFGFASPPVLVKLGFNSGSTNLKNTTCESISQKKS